MPSIKQQQAPAEVLPALTKAGIKIKKYSSAASFEKDLKRFLKRNQILHLSTSKNDAPRSTPVGYKTKGLTFYIFSEGGGKFDNLKANRQASFSIAEPYRVEDDFWGYKGLQAWGKAKVYGRKENPKKFKEAFEAMAMRVGSKKFRFEDLNPRFNHRIIEITPDRIRYTNPREGVLRVIWSRKG